VNRIRCSNRFLALLLLVLTLHMPAHGLLLPGFGLDPFQCQDLGTFSLWSDDRIEQTHVGDFKPPKHSFIDYTTMLFPVHDILTHFPGATKTLACLPFLACTQVYPEIHVPPDNPT